MPVGYKTTKSGLVPTVLINIPEIAKISRPITFHTTSSFNLYPRPFVFIYDYIDWDEKKVVNPLLEHYDWEIDHGTTGTWRIGDGTAALYNLLYYLMSGFTEHDTFRSNQIRENKLSRKEALDLVELDNLPRVDSLFWYCEVLGLDLSNLVKEMYKFDSLEIPINNFN